MLSKIIGFSIRNKLIIGLFTLALAGYGVYETTRLPIDAVPDITNNQVQVITVASSFGATDIERLVTFPIEQATSNIHGLKEVRSFSRFGLSLVTLVFADDIDVYWARQQVAERLQKVQTEIPKGIGNPELGPISTGLGEIYQYVVRPKAGYESKYDATALRTLQDWVVRRQLLGVEGIAEVSSFGGRLKQYEVAVNPRKLQSYNLSISDVFGALEKNNQNTGGSYIEKGPSVLFIRTEGLITTKEDIENISIKSTSGGAPLFIRDVAQVNFGHATRYGALCYNDQGEVSGAVVMMLKGANSNEVVKRVKERVAQIQKTLPEGVIIEPFLDRTKMVENAIGTVEKNLLEGALIVVFILVLFLGNFRAGLIVASVIPLSMLFAIILMNQFGVSGNLMSLGALDFGLIVDGAVIIVEAVMHQLSHNRKLQLRTSLSQAEMDEQVKLSAGKMMNSAVFGQVIILIVYLPIFTLHGIEGKMFKPMAQTVAFALLGAFILSLTYIPMMSALFLDKKIRLKPNFSDRIMARIEAGFQTMLIRVIKFPKVVLGTVFTLFLLAVYVLSTLGGEFIPALEEGDFAVETRVLTGSSLATTIASTQKTAGILKSRFPEVEKVVTKIGNSEVPTDPMPMEFSDMMVILKDKKEWTSASTFSELSEKMGKALSEVPGVTIGFQYPVQMRFNELMTGARQDVVCKIFGENLDTLSHYAQQLGKLVNTVEGSQGLYVEPVTGMPEIVIRYNHAAVAQYGLAVEDINKAVNAAFAGQQAGVVFEGEKRFGLVVRLEDTERKSVEDVQQLLIPTAHGTQIPLHQLADVSVKIGPNQIQREDAKRRIIVGFNIKDRDVQSIVHELREKAETRIKLPPGYYITYGGAFENLNEAKKRLMVAVPVSLAMIFILLFFAFGSVKHGLLIYTAIPLSAIGGIFFLALRGMPFSISAGVGFIALFGVAVLNGIVLVSEFNRLKKAGGRSLYRVVITGTKVRLRPVLMTAFVASLGFLPMALSNGAGAEVQKPLATVVIGGLLIATFLTLFVLPVLYLIFEKTSRVKPKKAVVAGLLLLTASNLQAQQTTISLDSAVALALKNNLGIKSERLRIAYQEKIIGSAKVIPASAISAEAGQLNSIYVDTRLSVAQSLRFPEVYTRQKQSYTEAWKAAQLGLALREADLRKSVSTAYYTLVILKEKEKLLLKADSLYAAFGDKTRLRFEKGESNVLEQSSAQLQRSTIQVQLSSLREEQELARLHFQWLLNAENPGEPSASSLVMALAAGTEKHDIEAHPLLKLYEQEVRVAEAATAVEKTGLLPDLHLGLNTMSMRGTGADNVLYTASRRFTSIQAGLSIPVFNKAQKARIEAHKVGELMALNQKDLQKKALESQYMEAMAQVRNRRQTEEYLRKTALPHATLLRQTADQQLNAGEIGFLDWIILVNQSLGLENTYLDAIKAYNESLIQLNYLTSNE